MGRLLSLALCLFFSGLALASPIGLTSNEQEKAAKELHCKPFTGFTIFQFIAVNFIAHCFTIKSEPGESALVSGFAAVHAFFSPVFGIQRSYQAILRHARLANLPPIEQAARAGALAFVTRDASEWKPLRSDATVQFKTGVRDRAQVTYEIRKPFCEKDPLPVFARFFRKNTTIHGAYSLPEGYEFKIVPSDAVVEPYVGNGAPSIPAGRPIKCDIASSFNTSKAIVGIIQTVYAGYTLYQSKSDQISRYGYAAFDLTVTPYILMSLLNLLANIVTPDYPALYLVRTPEMDEAEARGGFFSGVVGRLVCPDGKSGLEILDRARLEPYKAQELQPIAASFIGRVQPFAAPSSASQQPQTPPPLPLMRLVRAEKNTGGNIRFMACSKFTVRRGQNGLWNRRRSRLARVLPWIGPNLVGCGALVIVGALSNGFQRGTESTHSQRTWIMLWMIGGIVLSQIAWLVTGILDNAWAEVKEDIERKPGIRNCLANYSILVLLLITVLLFFDGILLAPGIGGLITIVKMMRDYENCTAL